MIKPQQQLLNPILKSVSRSFYLSLKIVPKKIRPSLGLAYLLCRAADTLADTKMIALDHRLKTLHTFKSLFERFPVSKEALSLFVKELAELTNLEGAGPAEEGLLKHLPESVALFNQSSRTDQALIQEVVFSVIEGMTLDLKFFGDSAENLKALPSEEELKTYITLIAGEPGRFWIKTCLAHCPELKIKSAAQWTFDGIQFGRGLQMINILRDLPRDLKNGRCYIPLDILAEYNLTPESLLDEKNLSAFLPLFHRLIDETLEYLKHGLSTLLEIPPLQLRHRAAIWWPLTIGLQTLAELRTSTSILDEKKLVKIDRSETYKILVGSLFKLPFNPLLRREFESRARIASSMD